MKNSHFVKNYFSANGTVSKWWNPTREEYRHIFLREIALIRNFLLQDKRLELKNALELSVGKGRLALNVHKLFKNYLATDISKEMLKITKKSDASLNVKQADAENLKFAKSNSFDYVFCLASLVHYPNPERAIKEISRVLKHGGKAIISADSKFSLKRIIKKLINQYYSHRCPHFNSQGSDIFQVYSRKKLLDYFKANNLKIQRIISLGMIAPIKYQTPNSKNKYFILTPKIAKGLRHMSNMLDKVPILNRLSTYQMYILEKNAL